MDGERSCRFCDNKHDLVRIFDEKNLKHKIETCLPIIVFQQYNIPDTICKSCNEKIDSFYFFIQQCIQNIVLLEKQYHIVESCLKNKRKVDQAVVCDPLDFPIKLLTIPEIETLNFDFKNQNVQLVDYDSSDEDEKPTIIDEIVQRKCLKRKITSPIVAPPSKIAKTEESSSRRKNSKPKRVEYHLESGTQHQQVCLLCEIQVPNMVQLAAHMFETHGIDFAQVYGGVNESIDPPAPKKKMPELVKISDVLNLGKLPPKLTVEVVGQQSYNNTHNTQVDDTLEITQINEPPPIVEASKPIMSSLNDSLFLCSECPDNRKPFTSFPEFSTHRRAQHQIFHCDLCPKFYGRNSHLWKHVNRVHKGHSAITCNQCGKTSASEYHLQQHKNKMHAAQQQQQITTTTVVETKQEPEPAVVETNDDLEDENDAILSDEDDLLNQKFQGFDFNSVKQSFLRQELLDKKNRYVSVLKKNNVFDDDLINKPDIKEKTPPPKEIDSTSDLYTTIITNYTPPTNEGPFKCPKCLKGFHKKNLVKKHKKNCRPRLQKDLLTRCKTCSRIFKDRQSLAKHLVNYHSEYTCEICSLAVQSKCEIVSHIRFTHPNSELQCYCGQILRSKQDLLKHKNEHRDSHVCQFCGDMLPTKIKLKMHILSLHRKILALSCGICLKLFETQHILRAHVKFAHADELKPLTSCTVCGKNYGSKWKTFDHLNKSHGRIFKACKICLEVFESEKDLTIHFDKEHINITNSSQTQNNPKMPQIVQNLPLKPVENKKSVKKTESKFVEKYVDSENEQEIYEFDNEQQQKNGKNNTSLLEKRLLNKDFESNSIEKKLLSTIETDMNNSSDDILQKNDDISSSKRQESSQNSDDILQNSSKRTVYVNSNDPSLCEICLKTWPAKKHLWQHYIRCHKTTAATVCGICLKTNPSYSALQRHLRDTHPKLLYGQGFGSNFICKICGRYHNASSKLRLHMAIHVGYNNTQIEPEEISENNLDNNENDDNDEKFDENKKIDNIESATRSSNSNSDDSEATNSESDEQDSENDETTSENSEKTEIKQELIEDDYYESLIEEIEASSDDDPQNDPQNDLENDLSSDDSRSQSPNLEQEMLRNMMCESKSQRLSVKSEPIDCIDQDLCEEIDIPDEEDVENGEEIDDYEYEIEIKEEIEPEDELNSAIQSICSSNNILKEENDENDQDVGYKRIHRVNESELAKAVGSIL